MVEVRIVGELAEHDPPVLEQELHRYRREGLHIGRDAINRIALTTVSVPPE